MKGPAPRYVVPGSVEAFIELANGLPIYCTGQFGIHPAVTQRIIDWLRGKAPAADFTAARDHWQDIDDWRARWSAARTGFGAMVVMTKAERLPETDDALADRGFGDHVIGHVAATEIAGFLEMGRPVGWAAFVPPRLRWRSAFAVETLAWFSGERWAQLFPAADGDPFRPVMSLFRPLPRAPALRAVGG